MADEIEIKILEINFEDLKQKLKNNSAVFVKKVFQKNQTYVNNFTDKEKVLVRVRDEGAQVFFTVKDGGRYEGSHRVREEVEILLHSSKDIVRMLDLMGFKKHNYYEYKREYYKLNECFVEFIDAPKIPTFIEVEGTIDKINETIKLLGFSQDDIFKGKIFEHYDQYTSNLRFENEWY